MSGKPHPLNFLNHRLGYTREFAVELAQQGQPRSTGNGKAKREWICLEDGREIQARFKKYKLSISFGRRSHQQEVRRWIKEARRPWLASLEFQQGESGLEGLLCLSRSPLNARLESVPEILLTEAVIEAMGGDFNQAKSTLIKYGGILDRNPEDKSENAVILMMRLPVHLTLADREGPDEIELFLSNEQTLICRLEGKQNKQYLVAVKYRKWSAEEKRELRNIHFVSAPAMPEIVAKQEEIRGGNFTELMPIYSPELTAWLEYEDLQRERGKALLEQREKVALEYDEVVGSPKRARKQQDKKSWRVRLKNTLSDCEQWLENGESFGSKPAELNAFVEIHSLEKGETQRKLPGGTLLVLEQQNGRIEATLEVDENISLPAKGKLLVRPHPGDEAQERRRDQALSRLRGAEAPNPDLLRNLLFPKTIAEVGGKNRALRYRVGGPSLNESQQQAVIRASKEPGIMLIQGPPGTGKTTVISEIILQLRHRYRNKDVASEGEERPTGPLRVLVSSIQNDAVANAADKLGDQDVFVDRHIRGEQSEDPTLELGGRTIAKKLWKSMEERESFVRYKRLCGLERTLQRFVPNLSEGEQHLVGYLTELRGSEYFEEFGRTLQDELQRLGDQLENIIEEEERLAQVQVEGDEKEEDRIPADLRTICERVLDSSAELILEDFNALIQLCEELQTLISEGPDAVKGEASELDGLARRCLRRMKRALQRQELDERLKESWQELREETERLLVGEEEEEKEEKPSPRQLWSKEMSEWVERARQYIQERLAEDGASEEAILFDWISGLNERPQNMKEIVADYAPVRAATCQVSARLYGQEEPYDMVIIDEAARGGIDVLIPMTMGRSIILIGDQNQLPPHIEQELERRLDEVIRRRVDLTKRSIFSYLWEAMGGEAAHQNCIALDKQYRMHRDIGEVISKVFYEPRGLRLKHHCPGGKEAERTPNFGLLDNRPFVWVDTSDVLQNSTSRRAYGSWPYTTENPYEVELILKLLKRLRAPGELDALLARVDLNRGEKAIGVIPFYQKQRELLQRAIDKEVPELRQYIELGTADSFQGKDFPLVFLSTVRSNSDGRVGFLDLPNRFNVGISRAKNQVILLGDSKTLVSSQRGSRPAKQIWELIKDSKGPGKVVMSRDI